MWEMFLTWFAYLDIGLTILVTYFTLPIVLAYLGIVYLRKWCIKQVK